MRLISEYKITVMFLLNYLGVGGAEQQVLELVRGIDKTRFHPIVATLYAGGALEPEIREVPGVELISLDRKGRYDFLILLKVFRVLRQKKVDIIQPFLTPATFFGIVPALLNRTPVKIITERCGLRRDVSWGNSTYRAIEDFLTRFATIIIPNSASGKSYLITRGIDSSRIKVIYNGINFNRLNPDLAKVARIKSDMHLPPDGKVVGIVARLHPAKDHFTFLKAAQLILQSIPTTRFAIVGDGPLRGELEGFAQELGIASEVTFSGNQRDVGSYISAFDVACLCSMDLEGCSNSTLEAMALGKPVVITDVGGNQEIVRHEETGLLVPARNPQALADGVLTCLRQPDWARDMGQHGRETVITRFSLARMVHDYEQLYEQSLCQN